MEHHLIDENEIAPIDQRPVFLTVLCILTWVGSGLSLLIGVFQFITYSFMTHSLNIDGVRGGNLFGWVLWGSIITCICALICAGAAIVMWKRRKWGFYVYTVAELIPPVFSLIISLERTLNNPFSLVITGLSLLFPIGFIVMYALNLKHMKR
jgi:hypothetical protein